MKVSSLKTLGAVWDYIYGTFKIRRILLLIVIGLSLLFTGPLFFRLAVWMRIDLIYVYVGVAYVTGFCMYGAFKQPLKSLFGSILMGWKYKPREFTPEEYAAYGVTKIVNAMGIKRRIRVYVTPNPWIEGPFTNAVSNKVYMPVSWMNRFPRLDMRGVLGHELGHVKTKGKFLRDFVVGIGGVIGATFFFGMYSITIIVTIFELALTFLVLTVISWKNERRADFEGARVTGPEGLISVFEVLLTESRRDDGSETHPPLRDRIGRLTALLGMGNHSITAQMGDS